MSNGVVDQDVRRPVTRRDAGGLADLGEHARPVLAVAEHDHDVDVAAGDHRRLVDEEALVLSGERQLDVDLEPARPEGGDRRLTELAAVRVVDVGDGDRSGSCVVGQLGELDGLQRVTGRGADEQLGFGEVVERLRRRRRGAGEDPRRQQVVEHRQRDRRRCRPDDRIDVGLDQPGDGVTGGGLVAALVELGHHLDRVARAPRRRC